MQDLLVRRQEELEASLELAASDPSSMAALLVAG
jgi:hypothetical protein